MIPPPKLSKWRRRRREIVGSYRILEVSRVELEDGAGRSRGDAFVVEVPPWCNVIPVTPDRQLVLVWQYRFGTEELSLEIPGGVVEPDEEPIAAAQRELREETGYEAARLEEILVVEPNPAIQNNRCVTFVAWDARPAGPASLDAMEELETVLLPLSEIGALLDSGQIRHALVQGALERFVRKHRC
jgi:8-oxo-dGTP pyrophosphatase MutT (NUDIX family)